MKILSHHIIIAPMLALLTTVVSSCADSGDDTVLPLTAHFAVSQQPWQGSAVVATRSGETLDAIKANTARVWDFSQSPTEYDLTALDADGTNWEKADGTYKNKTAAVVNGDGALVAGGQELELTAGLQLSSVGATDKIRITPGRRLTLNGSDIVVTVPALKTGQKVEVLFASTSASEARTLTPGGNVSPTSAVTSADYNTPATVEVTMTADGNAPFTTGCGIYLYSIRVTRLSTDGFMAFSTTLGDSERHIVWDNDAEQWLYGNPILWSNNVVPEGVTGYAYWPTTGSAATDASDLGISFSTANGTITFTPGGLDSQTDLLWARASNANGETTIGTDGTINLDFRHALAQLSFGHITNDYGHDIVLQSVTVSGTPYQSGVLDLGYGAGKDGTWTNLTPNGSELTKTYGSLNLSVPNGQSKNLGLDPILQLPGPTLTVTFTFTIEGQTETVATSVVLQQGVDKRVNMTVDRNHEVVIAD